MSADVSDPEFRVALGALLKRHLLFANLIELLKGRVHSLPELQQQMGPLPESARVHPAGARCPAGTGGLGPGPGRAGAAGDDAAAGVDA